MKILVLSDSHRTLTHMEQAVRSQRPDRIVHLGDHARDAQQLQSLFPEIPLCSVPGNCDFQMHQQSPMALEELGGVRFLLTHGHAYGVKQGLLRLELAARAAGAQVALFGHTHTPFCQEKDGLWLLNPGTCMGGSRPSCGVVLVESGKILCYNITNLCEGEIPCF